MVCQQPHLLLYLALFSLVLTPLTLASCTSDQPGQATIPENYTDVTEIWKENRIASLTAPTGWMRLAGMFFLTEGENTFGSSPEADVQLPDSTLPPVAGTFHLADQHVNMDVHESVSIYADDEPVHSALLYNPELDSIPRITYNQLEWLVIARQDLTAIRLYNKENEKADQFTGFPHYEINSEWRRQARFVPYPEGTAIPIANVLGQVEDFPSPGRIEFTIGNTLYSLDALEGSERMFIIVGDQTNGKDTYGAGRYIYIDYPDDNRELTVIDFNLAYNPPCAFNTFTTCQLPPMQNRLDVAITAGEKTPIGWDGL